MQRPGSLLHVGTSARSRSLSPPAPRAPATPQKHAAAAARPSSRHQHASGHTTAPAAARPMSAKRKRPAWVVADWKHRVPEPPRRKPCAHDSLTAAQAAAQDQAQRQQHAAAAEFDAAYATIDRMMHRCKLAQEQMQLVVAISKSSKRTCGSSTRSGIVYNRHGGPISSSSSKSGSGSAASTQQHPSNGAQQQRPFLTPRSRLLFEEPCYLQQQQQQQALACARSSSGAAMAARAGVFAPIDLNPGFAFRPGTAQRTAAIARHSAGGDATPRASTCNSIVPAPAPAPAASAAGSLTHREALQAGLQVLTAEMHGAIKQRQQQGYQQSNAGWRQPGIGTVPLSWFGR